MILQLLDSYSEFGCQLCTHDTYIVDREVHKSLIRVTAWSRSLEVFQLMQEINYAELLDNMYRVASFTRSTSRAAVHENAAGQMQTHGARSFVIMFYNRLPAELR